MPDSSPARRLSFPVWMVKTSHSPVTRSTVALKQGRRPAVNQVRASTYKYDFHMPLSTAVSRSLSLHLRRNGAAAFPFQAIRGDGTFGVAMPGISKPILKSSNGKMTGIMTRVQVENIH
ncbi:hypothetical protein GE21DRAFT_1347340 [Neurospora crassa]|nr:hypothetical protein GE21DRAFT_1347340 [Neurospora crassa]